MPGKHITQIQYHYYIKLRGTGMTHLQASLKTDISERSGRRLEKRSTGPSQKGPRSWRTRSNPFASVWEGEVVPLLQKSCQITARTILDHLQERHKEAFPDLLLRTLQRHVKKWRALYGQEKEVMFYQNHPPGQRGLSDFTHFKDLPITIQGAPFDHLLYHFRLGFSGWRWVEVIQGGESFTALSQGLQNALWQLGGCPEEHRSDSLSAAYKNISRDKEEDFTKKYTHLMDHYHMKATRNNRGVAHENGSIEGAHGPLKHQLHQALLLRGSSDFESVKAYQDFVQALVKRLNGRQNYLIKQERPHLQPLPQKRTTDFEELRVRVTKGSAIQVKGTVYTVPSRLIGNHLRVHLYHDRLVGFLGHTKVVEHPRLYGPAKEKRYCVTYRHVIHSLVKKPQAFAQSLMREALLPTPTYREIWQKVQQMCSLPQSCRLIVGLLKLAADSNQETRLGEEVLEALDKGQLPCLGDLTRRYGVDVPQKKPPLPWEPLTEVPSDIPLVPLADYDVLFSSRQESAHA